MTTERKDLIVTAAYRHDKNQKVYVFVQMARNPNTLQDIVVYFEDDDERDTDGMRYWRPVDEFCEKFTPV